MNTQDRHPLVQAALRAASCTNDVDHVLVLADIDEYEAVCKLDAPIRVTLVEGPGRGWTADIQAIGSALERLDWSAIKNVIVQCSSEELVETMHDHYTDSLDVSRMGWSQDGIASNGVEIRSPIGDHYVRGAIGTVNERPGSHWETMSNAMRGCERIVLEQIRQV